MSNMLWIKCASMIPELHFRHRHLQAKAMPWQTLFFSVLQRKLQRAFSGSQHVVVSIFNLMLLPLSSAFSVSLWAGTLSSPSTKKTKMPR